MDTNETYSSYYSSTSTFSSMILKKYDVDRNLLAYHGGFIRPKQKVVKKTDPVNRYHQTQEIRSNDKFLQNMEKPRRMQVEYPPYQPFVPP